MNQEYRCHSRLSFFKHKTTITVFGLVVLFLLVGAPALALETGLGYGTFTGLGTTDLRITIMRIIQIALGFVGVIAIIIILYAGFVWMTSGGNAEKIDTAKRILRNAVIGLVIIFSAFSIVSFIISQLQSATGIGAPPPGGIPGGCENCGYLGTGIIERVYPTPFARNVARNTNIMVTFKVTMKPSTIIAGAASTCSAASPCVGDLVDSNVMIFQSSQNQNTHLVGTDVQASSVDGKTFVFNPKQYLGDGVSHIWYSVKLNNGIQKDNGESAFPGAGGYFLWRFEVGTILDLDPPFVDNIFPPPDNQSDNYSLTSATQATGSIVVKLQPQVAQTAATSQPTGTTGSPTMTVSGTYNCSVDAVVCVTDVSGPQFSVNAKAPGTTNCSTGTSITVPGLSSSATLNNGAVNVGCGLTLTFASSPADGNQWQFNAQAQKTADTLRIGNKQFTFGTTADTNTIVSSPNVSTTAQNITDQINGAALGVQATRSNATVTLTASTAGAAGNLIPVQASNSWATVNPMAGGQDAGLQPTTKDAPDVKRNAAIMINFDKAIDPNQINKNNIVVEYDKDGAGTWTAVDGNFFVSNQYKTVEFLSANACVDASGNPISNSCGEKIYCLPVIQPDPSPYQATHYRVTIKAGLLKSCSTNADCTDPNFNTCAPTPGNGGSACQGKINTVNVFYPEAQAVPNGIIDAANNSFNGNKNTYTLNSQIFGRAEGPQAQSGQAPYSLNTKAANTGDDLVWSFYVNKSIDLTPPNVTQVDATIASSDVSLTAPVKATYDEVMLSSTLKPGSNYRDGYCYCTANSQCNTGGRTGETCDTTRNRCVNPTNQQYCVQDNECGTVPGVGQRCVNKKYVTLIDKATQSVGWWVSKNDLDTKVPPTGYANITQAQINHTSFLQVTNYGSELGSGVQDIYQNCFLPSKGPSSSVCSLTATNCSSNSDCTGANNRCVSICNPATGANCCPVDVTASPPKVYCCNGAALTQSQWESSQCFTGY